jgi:hypothetical protein
MTQHPRVSLLIGFLLLQAIFLDSENSKTWMDQHRATAALEDASTPRLQHVAGPRAKPALRTCPNLHHAVWRSLAIDGQSVQTRRNVCGRAAIKQSKNRRLNKSLMHAIILQA